MKATSLFSSLLIIVLLLGCQKENDIRSLSQSPDDNIQLSGLTIEEGQFYFNRLHSSDSLTRQGMNTGRIFPKWPVAFSGVNNKQQKYIEVPVTIEKKRVILFLDSSSLSNTDKQKQKQSVFQTLVIFEGGAGKVYYRLVSYVGSTKYLQNHNYDIGHNRIGKLDDDFEGYLHYSNERGEHLFSLEIENGRPVRKIVKESASQKKAVPDATTASGYEVCTTECWEITEWTCWQTYITVCPPGGECYEMETGEECGDEVVSIECYEECTWIEDEDPNPPCYDQTDPNGECDDFLPCDDCGDGGDGEAESTMGVDCSSFAFSQTTTANWQEAGLNKIRLKWVWIDFHGSGQSITREIWIDHVVFGLPKVYGNGASLTAGEAAILTADAIDRAKLLTYKEFRNSPSLPQESTVVTFFKNAVHSAMIPIGGTAGTTGSGSPNIIFRNEIRASFSTRNCQ